MKGKLYQRGKLVPILKPCGGSTDRPLIRGACRKVVLQSRKVAKRAMKELRQRERLDGRDPDSLNIYWCHECDAWHVGHLPAWAREGGRE